jgi:hypothetical protein
MRNETNVISAGALSLALLLIPMGCAQRTMEPGEEQPSSVPAASQPASTANVFSSPAAYLGQTVEVAGVFGGYQVSDCRFAPGARSTSLTRSDWLLRGGAYCLYVTGGNPSGFDPTYPGANRDLDVRAKVIDGGDGQAMLQLIDARPR